MFICLNIHGGNLSNLTFENIYEKKGAYNKNNYFVTQINQKGSFNNIVFDNYYIEEKKISSGKEMNLIQGYATDKTLNQEITLFTPTFK